MRSVYRKLSILGLVIIFIIFVGFIGYRSFFYYKMSPLEQYICRGEKGDFDAYSISSTELKEQVQPFFIEEIKDLNSKRGIKEVSNPREAVNIVQNLSNELYDGCKLEQPFLIYFNKNENTWIVHGNYLKMARKNMFGGDICVIIDKMTGYILYVEHTM